MKECRNVKEVIKVYEETMKEYYGEVDVEYVKQVREAYIEFTKKYKIEEIQVFTEDNEFEDEEFGIAFIETLGWKKVYMCGNNGEVKFMLE